MSEAFDPRQLVSSKQLGAVLGLTERRVQQLESEQIFQNVGKGRSKRYHLDTAIQAVLEKSETDAKRSVAEASTSRELFEAERARKLKLDNDQTESLLVETPDAIAAIDAIFGEVRTALAGIAPRFTEDVAERRRLDDAIDAILTDLADRLDKAVAALRTGSDPAAADAADDA